MLLNVAAFFINLSSRPMEKYVHIWCIPLFKIIRKWIGKFLKKLFSNAVFWESATAYEPIKKILPQSWVSDLTKLYPKTQTCHVSDKYIPVRLPDYLLHMCKCENTIIEIMELNENWRTYVTPEYILYCYLPAGCLLYSLTFYFIFCCFCDVRNHMWLV